MVGCRAAEFVEGLDRVEGFPEGSYAIATKLHHAAVDGASVLKFYRALVDIDKKGTPAGSLYSREWPPTCVPGLSHTCLPPA